jgi:hypothetical protein
MARRSLKYRYLTRRDGTIYYQRTLSRQRIRFSLETDDLDRAAELRDLYEAQNGIRHGASIRVPLPVPTFAEMAERYLAKGMKNLAPTVRDDRRSHLQSDRPISKRFGARSLDAISQADLLRWWEDEVEGQGRAMGTGLNHLGAISAVFRYAVRHQLISSNPCRGLQEVLREDRRTKGGRAASSRSDHIRPISEPAELEAFVAASKALAVEAQEKIAAERRVGKATPASDRPGGARDRPPPARCRPPARRGAWVAVEGHPSWS